MQTIYIMDYETDIAFVLCEWFKSKGFEARSFSLLEKLLQNVQQHQPDCIILDCLYGRIALTADVCHTLRQAFHYKGALFLTSTSTLSAKDLQLCKVSHFIAKPFDFGKILKLVKEPAENAFAGRSAN